MKKWITVFGCVLGLWSPALNASACGTPVDPSHLTPADAIEHQHVLRREEIKNALGVLEPGSQPFKDVLNPISKTVFPDAETNTIEKLLKEFMPFLHPAIRPDFTNGWTAIFKDAVAPNTEGLRPPTDEEAAYTQCLWKKMITMWATGGYAFSDDVLAQQRQRIYDVLIMAPVHASLLYRDAEGRDVLERCVQGNKKPTPFPEETFPNPDTFLGFFCEEHATDASKTTPLSRELYGIFFAGWHAVHDDTLIDLALEQRNALALYRLLRVLPPEDQEAEIFRRLALPKVLPRIAQKDPSLFEKVQAYHAARGVFLTPPDPLAISSDSSASSSNSDGEGSPDGNII